MSASFEPNVNVGELICGFSVQSIERLPEIDGSAVVMRHLATGMPLMWLACPDENKSFSITFKTPPADNTGVFHILEHSVLCGSERYPVKEPFVNLLKTSMQTFLNALTFSDKTMYPVASTNERDLLNLVDVYMDAVTHPAFFRKPEIFEQEGWHVELPSADAEPTLSGVVLNEMRGALADPDSVALDGLCAALFPDNAYGFESGGDPRFIPTLTYEAFLDTFERHYCPSNARVVLYGDLALEPVLDLLDSRYLSCARGRKAPGNPLVLQAPVVCTDDRRPMVTLPENATVSLGYVIGTHADRLRCLACEILVDALMGSNEAPLKRTLLDADLGCDVDAFLYDGVLQPFVVFQLRGADPDTTEAFQEAVVNAVAALVEGGIPRENLEASLESMSFSLRERDMGCADGVALAISAMAGWLYDDAAPTAYLRYEDELSTLRDNLGTSYWEDLLRSVVLDSDHHACSTLVPIDRAESDQAPVALTEAERAQAVVRTAHLHEVQEAPDTPEQVSTLPRVHLSDIPPARGSDASTLLDDTPLPCLYHPIATRRIGYANHYFGLDGLTWEDLPYVSLMCTLLGKMDTASHTAAQLDTLLESRLGRLSFQVAVHEDCSTHEVTPRVACLSSALSENAAHLASLPAEVWGTTLFDDTPKIRELLEQQKYDSEQSFVNSGNSFALARAYGYTSRGAYLAQHFGGVDYYRFVCGLLGDWDSVAAWLPQRLEDVRRRVFCAGDDLHSFAGSRENLAAFWSYAKDLGLPGRPDGSPALVVPEPPAAREAFVIPSEICFAAKAFAPARTPSRAPAAPGCAANGTRPDTEGTDYHGSWAVAARAVNYGYLWDNVRVKGGAYGCRMHVNHNGTVGFASYRDPNLDSTLACYDGVASWLAGFTPTHDELEGYVVSTVARHDEPVTAAQNARRRDVEYLTGREESWRPRLREQILGTDGAQVRGFSNHLEGFGGSDAVCVFGSRDILEASAGGLEVVDLVRSAD